MEKCIQVVTTVEKKEDAEKIAGKMLDLKLVACVQIFPCQSMYRWQGKIENAGEYTCIMKSRSGLFPELKKAIKAIHPYDVPEILAFEVAAGSADYLEWLMQELKKNS